MELHGETVWASIAAVFITAVIGWLFYWLTVRPKRFSWEVMSLNPLISAPDSADLALEVIAGGEKMTNPNIMVIRLGNTGRKSIHEKDFDGPITLKFDTTMLISSDLPVKRGFSYGTVMTSKTEEITPRLIKPREYTDLQFITDGPLEPPEIDVRFDGKAGPIANSVKIDQRVEWSSTLFALTVMTVLLSVSAFLVPSPRSLPLWQRLFVTAPVLVTAFLMVWARLVRIRNSTRWR